MLHVTMACNPILEAQQRNKRNTMLRFKGSSARDLRKRPALFKSAQWHFHQDNIPDHNFILVTDYLTKMGIETVRHPLYSPDLAPCDFCLFPKLKEKLSGIRDSRKAGSL